MLAITSAPPHTYPRSLSKQYTCPIRAHLSSRDRHATVHTHSLTLSAVIQSIAPRRFLSFRYIHVTYATRHHKHHSQSAHERSARERRSCSLPRRKA